MKRKLQKLQKDISPPKSGKSKRIPQGFSMRKEIPKSDRSQFVKDVNKLLNIKMSTFAISTGKCMNCNTSLINIIAAQNVWET